MPEKGTMRANVRTPAGSYLSGSPGVAPGSSVVNPTAVFDGLICAIPASLRIGSDTGVPPELNSPKYPAVDLSCAALRAFADVASGVQVAACAVESSSGL